MLPALIRSSRKEDDFDAKLLNGVTKLLNWLNDLVGMGLFVPGLPILGFDNSLVDDMPTPG